MGASFRIERIVSTGLITPLGQWYDQCLAEWVLLLAGEARLPFGEPDEEITLRLGDVLLIPAHQRHRLPGPIQHSQRFGWQFILLLVEHLASLH